MTGNKQFIFLGLIVEWESKIRNTEWPLWPWKVGQGQKPYITNCAHKWRRWTTILMILGLWPWGQPSTFLHCTLSQVIFLWGSARIGPEASDKKWCTTAVASETMQTYILWYSFHSSSGSLLIIRCSNNSIFYYYCDFQKNIRHALYTIIHCIHYSTNTT